jgi:hypothetical protein
MWDVGCGERPAAENWTDADPGMRALAETSLPAQKAGNADSEALLDHTAGAGTLLDKINSYALWCDRYKASLIECRQNAARDRCEGGAVASDARNVGVAIQAIKNAKEKMDPKR